MGFDIVGCAPRSPAGEYFRVNNVWWTHLWRYCEVVAPALTSRVKHGYTNDGDGLGDADARALGELLLTLSERRPLFDEKTDYVLVREFALFLVDCGGFALL